MNPIDILIDQRRALAAQLAAKELEIAMALGDRAQAMRHMREMQAQVTARRAVREVAEEEGCYFDAQGQRDAQALKEAA